VTQEYRFAYELSPDLRAAAALETEHERLISIVSREKKRFHRELRRAGGWLLLCAALFAAFVHAPPPYPIAFILALLALVVFIGVTFRVLEFRRPPLLVSWAALRRARREAARWEALMREVTQTGRTDGRALLKTAPHSTAKGSSIRI
jgi:hypothetical protein